MADTFDYVIVGAGAAGSILAARLTEDPGVTVCVLEAGPPDRNPWIHIPAGVIKTLVDPSVTWQFKTAPTERTGGRAISTTQGRTLGPGAAGAPRRRGPCADADGAACAPPRQSPLRHSTAQYSPPGYSPPRSSPAPSRH